MNICGCRNVRKQREITVSDKYVTLHILLKFGILDKMRITSSETKDNLGRSGKGFITSLGIKEKIRPKRYKEARYAIGSVSMKYLIKIIREFKKLPYKIYERRMPKHEPTDSYFYLSIKLANVYNES